MTSQEDTMKRTSFIRRRRYLLGFAFASLAVAALLPQAALARPDSSVDPYTTSSITAEDVHGLSAGTGYVLPAADQAAVDQARAGAVPVRADDFAPPRNVQVSGGSTASSVNWGQVSFLSALGLIAIIGVLMLALTANRRGTRVAHS
jgi:hypothetical protein